MSQNGNTTLILAALKGHTECLSVLLDREAAIGDKTNVCKIEHTYI